MRRRVAACALATGLGVATHARAAEPPVAFVNTGTDCRNLLVQGAVDPAVARELVPSRFALADPPSGFVELASCPGGQLDGRELGAFRIAEAAVVIATPAPSPGADGTITQDIFALSQLDSDGTLSAAKRGVGFTSELVDIRLDGDALGVHYDAAIPWPVSPYTMAADVTPSSPPLPGITLVTRIWGLGDRGLVVTRNDISLVRSASFGRGTASFAPGSPLARLFGTTTLEGTAISGRGDFTNVTRIIEPATTAAPTAPVLTARVRRGRLRIAATGTSGPLRATVRRGRRPPVRTLRGTRSLSWDGRTARGRRVAPGTYTVRVRPADARQVLATFRVRVGRAGPQRVLA